MTVSPLVSIIVPAYNTGRYIGEMLECCRVQTWHNIEVVVVDDGSPDDTAHVARAYCELDARFRLALQSNRGVSAARNKGIGLASGEKLLFLDSDDTFEPDLVAKCLETLERTGAEAVLYGYADGTLDAPGRPHEFEISGVYKGRQIVERLVPHFIGHSFEDIEAWIRGEKGMRQGKEHTALWRAMIDAETVRANSLTFDETMSLGEDTLFINEYLIHADSVAVLDECLYYLRQRDGSANATSNGNPVLMLENKLKVIRAREKVGAAALREKGFDLWPFWRGTNVLSLLQLCLELGKRRSLGCREGWQQLKRFESDPSVRKSLAEYKPKGGGIRSLPFRMVKAGMLPMLYILARFAPTRVL